MITSHYIIIHNSSSQTKSYNNNALNSTPPHSSIQPTPTFTFTSSMGFATKAGQMATAALHSHSHQRTPSAAEMAIITQEEKHFVAQFSEQQHVLPPEEVQQDPRNKDLGRSSKGLSVRDFELVRTLGTGMPACAEQLEGQWLIPLYRNVCARVACEAGECRQGRLRQGLRAQSPAESGRFVSIDENACLC